MSTTFEKSLWQYVKKGMGKTWNATRHEDRATPGIPDVSFGLRGVNGWIELKTLAAWPKRSTTPVPLPRLTIPQRIFLIRRGQYGGSCWLLLRVGMREHLLIPWDNLAINSDDWTRADWINAAVGHWEKGIDFDIFPEHLRGGA